MECVQFNSKTRSSCIYIYVQCFNIPLFQQLTCDRSNEGNLCTDTVYPKGYFTNAVESFTNQILGYIVQTRQVVKFK